MEYQYKLTSEQKEAIGLLSIGSFLEYADLMLYIHMAVLLNEIFFPKTDPYTAGLISAFAFWSTYLLRPFGALVFGYIGDYIGRKATVIITTLIMSFACVTMALVKTYDEIGIKASIIVTLCRMLQGMSCIGEVSGAELYLTETIKPPIQYPAVTAITVFSALGATAALLVASMVTSPDGNWRIAFWIGSVIAIVGMLARTALKETPDFVDAKLKLKKTTEMVNGNLHLLKSNPIMQESACWKTTLSYFLIRCAWPACFYFVYIHCSNILRDTFNFTPGEIISQNFIISMAELVSAIIILYLSKKIYPLKILKAILIIYSAFILIIPWLFEYWVDTSFKLLFIQMFGGMFGLGVIPAIPILYKHFPVFKRFTYTSFLYALSRILMYGVTSFGLVYLTKYYSHYGLLVIMVPVIITYAFSILHFEALERKSGNYNRMFFDNTEVVVNQA